MGDKAAFLRVGLLLFAGLAGVVGLLLWFGRGEVRTGLHYETYFRESVQGLTVGSPVMYRGVAVGQVTEIGLVTAAYGNREEGEFMPASFGLVYVRFVIDPTRLGQAPDTATAVRLGLRVRLASQGITGLAYLEIDFVDPERFPAMQVPWQPRDAYIPSMPSTLKQVETAAQALMAKLQGVALDKLADSMQRVLDDVHGELSSGGDAHAALAAAAELTANLRDSVKAADIPGLAADARAAAEAVRTAAQGPVTKDLLASSSRAADRLADAANRLPPLIASLEQTVRRINMGASDLQADLAPALRDVRATAANLRDASEELRRYPAGVLLGGPPPRTEEGR